MSREHNLEPDTFGETETDHAIVSIAISLKRIADLLDGTAMSMDVTDTSFNPRTVQNRDVRNVG